MEWIFNLLKGPALYGFVALGLTKLGTWLKNKDTNTTGTDDFGGDLCIKLAPVIAALEDNHDTALKKALKTVRDLIDSYLQPAT